MVDVLRRKWYVKSRVLIETARILDAQFKPTILEISGAELEILRNLMMYVNWESTFASEYYSRYYLTPTVSEWDDLQAVVANLEEKLMLVYVDDYVCLRDKKAQGVGGGDFEHSTWRTRDINDEQSDSSGICSIEGNQITLQAGTYRCFISCPAYKVNQHRTRLWNVTDSVEAIGGTSEYTSVNQDVVTRSLTVGSFVLVSSKVLEVQHRCASTRLGNGFGVVTGMGEEVYTIAEFWRMIG